MSKSNAQKIAQQKYDQKSYDQILIKVKKGKREEYKQSADKLGLGQMEMIRLAVEKFIAERSGESFTQPEKPESLSADDRRLLDEFNQLPLDTRKALVKFVKSINQAGVVVKPGDQNTPK